MKIAHLRLAELAAATLVSLTVLAGSVAPALLASGPTVRHTTAVGTAAAVGIEYEARPAPLLT